MYSVSFGLGGFFWRSSGEGQLRLNEQRIERNTDLVDCPSKFDLSQVVAPLPPVGITAIVDYKLHD